MKDADPMIAGVWRALCAGGRFVAECGGRGCIATIVAGLYEALTRRGIDGSQLNPWYFPGADEYMERLTRNGFRFDFIALIRRPTPLPGDLAGWMDTFTDSFTAALAPSDRRAFLDEVREILRPGICDREGRWIADYVLLRFAAVKPP
jgi:hypothetical protein